MEAHSLTGNPKETGRVLLIRLSSDSESRAQHRLSPQHSVGRCGRELGPPRMPWPHPRTEQSPEQVPCVTRGIRMRMRAFTHAYLLCILKSNRKTKPKPVLTYGEGYR